MNTQAVEILLVDDNDDDVVMMREAIDENSELKIVQTACNGQQALDFLRRCSGFEEAKRPDLVLLDINMPGLNGFEVLQQIRSDVQLREIPVVMLTSSRREEDVAQSYAEGACSFITKPIGFDHLRDTIQLFSKYWTCVSVLPSIAR